MVDSLEIRRARQEERAEMARLIAQQNQTPELQCLHSGEGEESILQTMLKWDKVSEICFAVAVQDGRLVGVHGAEFDEELARGWLWGPFVLTGDWSAVAAALLAKLLDLLPPAVRRLDFFVDERNQRALRFYLGQGFSSIRTSHVYVARGPAVLLTPPEPCQPLVEGQADAFRALHDSIFPKTYYTGQDILGQLDGDHQVFVCGKGEDLWGYIYAIVDEGGEGYVEFLGVRADMRGRGLGQRLLLTALDWLFAAKNVAQVGLTVSDDQVHARSLYEKAGFRIKFTGLSARKEW
jgi:ribosomal protein S18 acetylase RimI-like enzyme